MSDSINLVFSHQCRTAAQSVSAYHPCRILQKHRFCCHDELQQVCNKDITFSDTLHTEKYPDYLIAFNDILVSFFLSFDLSELSTRINNTNLVLVVWISYVHSRLQALRFIQTTNYVQLGSNNNCAVQITTDAHLNSTFITIK